MTAEEIEQELFRELATIYGELDADEMVSELRATHDNGDCRDCDDSCPICDKEKRV